MKKTLLSISLIASCLLINNANAAAQNTTLQETGGGLAGYIFTNVAPAPAGYGYGVSFYTQVWPLIQKPLATFQIGLPSTWLNPNNDDDVKTPLCPTGTFARDHWPERGPRYREVFQSIEGGLGYWTSSQFPLLLPKFGMNSTADCYTNQVATSNWAAGKRTAVAPNLMSIAQLSNHILMPPDGVTFNKQTTEGFIGFAWMALPISPNKTAPAPTGDQSWTLFINAANFAGPIAFFIPNNWSRLSQTYSAIVGRGLDARPALMNGGAMEVNTVPLFKSQDKSGTVYTRIPQIQFPVDGNGQTRLLQDIYFYSQQAFYTPLKNSLSQQQEVPRAFDISSAGAVTPTCKTTPLNFNQNKIPVKGLDATVETFVNNDNGKCLFGLQWTHAKNGFGYFPTYFKQVGNTRQAVPVNQVPNTTHLQAQAFKTITGGEAYQVPAQYAAAWNNTSKAVMRAKLDDGSTVLYRWYRFVDQPSLQHLNLTSQQKDALQAIVVKLHHAWAQKNTFMPAPSYGHLVQIDNALLVTPPAGMEYGYVPVVIGQSR